MTRPSSPSETAPPAPGAGPDGRIGPNAIIRVAESLRHRKGDAAARRLFVLAGAEASFDAPPRDMVPEGDVRHLHGMVRAEFGPDDAHEILREAGLRTGDYLLAHRIPRLAQRLLKVLPAGLAARSLVKAIQANAWTFVGSGGLAAEAGPPLTLVITDSPICRETSATAPICSFYTGTFQRLFQSLVSPKAHVTETTCSAAGAAACRFTIAW